ncbi:signal peptidase II [Paenibacillus cellulosilyticus]|uniref:Lipoprotein signal peptidase n=1 Tax=Paenibacillus cellulosilyticus TaxID=375489 RepID=A0A2V2YD42_9BACL|nr:signal peptidase II [Paenibacillus cellulosilyticus]PWV89387.1 signal peptidase II [Paenibacillus cellulosilyticus]
MLRLLFYLVISGITFLVDYISKKMIVNELDLNEQVRVIGEFFVITSIRNTGAAFSLLENQRVFFLIITIIITIGLVGYMTFLSRKKGRALLLTGLALVLGGALGNFIDRARTGEVVDFLQFTFGSYTFAIFNLADTAICIGVGLIVLDSLLAARAEKQAYVDNAIAASYSEPKQPQE